ncbi:hypothetical protein [Pengzhenrongella frigida]|uniref:Polysaccharide biosynthesis protein n=1 Tax=Pengzhenrongella frigida TaxID=1259133 RepID=A0A4Q5MZR6_9MICO|nr:hypothetical protein [Cellulomonas sp. HLT2-17]RYV51362.1 hypothetical protein EUA98_08735 [Cellulomonas sp. HLT2-17]
MNERRAMRLGYLKRHTGPLMTVGAVSVLGIFATAVFHAVTGRGLGPEAFGLLAAFLSIVNIAAIGASALQNSVAVGTARSLAETVEGGGVVRPTRRWDSATIEALVLGGVGTLVVVVFAPLLADQLATSALAIYLAALTILPSFLFSVAQGRLQAVGRATSVAGWSTSSQILRVVLAASALAAGLGAVSVLLAVLIAITAAAVAAGWQVRGSHLRTATTAFSSHSIVLIMLTLSFAWLTNIDVMLVRMGTSESHAGMFAAAAVLGKMILIVPTTLSLYLLPRFVNRQGDRGAMKFGVNVILLTVLGSGLVAVLGMTLLRGFLISLFFGAGYTEAADLLPWLALAYLPWALAQGLLIRLTAAVSRLALAVLIGAAVIQWVAVRMVLPDLGATIVVVGVLGVLVVLSMLVLVSRHSRKMVAAE